MNNTERTHNDTFNAKECKCLDCKCKTCKIAHYNGGAPGCGDCVECFRNPDGNPVIKCGDYIPCRRYGDNNDVGIVAIMNNEIPTKENYATLYTTAGYELMINVTFFDDVYDDCACLSFRINCVDNFDPDKKTIEKPLYLLNEMLIKDYAYSISNADLLKDLDKRLQEFIRNYVNDDSQVTKEKIPHLDMYINTPDIGRISNQFIKRDVACIALNCVIVQNCRGVI